MGKTYTIPNHNVKFVTSFTEKPASELQEFVRFFCVSDNQDLLTSFQARSIYVFSPVLRDLLQREIIRRKSQIDPKEKLVVIPVYDASVAVMEKVAQLLHSGCVDISRQHQFNSFDFEKALNALQIEYMVDGAVPRLQITGFMGLQGAAAQEGMISGDDYYPPSGQHYFQQFEPMPIVPESPPKRGRGRGRGRGAGTGRGRGQRASRRQSPSDSSESSEEFEPAPKKTKKTPAKPSGEKKIWRCGFDCPGVFFNSLREQTDHHANVHKVDFGNDRGSGGKSHKKKQAL